MNHRYILPYLALFLLTTPGLAQRDAKIPDPDPELERKTFQVAPGFEVNLYAADPLLAKPIQMNFDPAGRLWIASSEVYPQIQPGQVANDKILILEDTKGEGRADKVTVFADGLLMPTGVVPGDGGAYVANSTELVHFSSSKPDGKADRKHVLLTGFGTEDTHHIIHTFRWGLEGALNFNQSIYIHSHIETPWGVRRLGGGGIWKFRPDSQQMEVFVRGFVNPWGHAQDRWGQSFATDGAYGEGVNLLIPGAYYVAAVGATRILAGLNPGSPKHCGLEIVGGRHLPDDWQGNCITNDFRAHRVCRFRLKDDGAGFASQELPELIKSTHPAFRPIDVKMGPDGAIYVADWYNPIIQHGEVDFRDPRRDHVHGRIWRVTARGRPLVPRPKLVGAATVELLEALKAPEDWTRNQARRVLQEKGKAVVPELAAWVQHLDANDPDLEHHLLEALWTYQSLDVVEPALLDRLLKAKDARARAAAVRVLAAWPLPASERLARLTPLAADESPRVRLETVRALGTIPDLQAARLALSVHDRPMDRALEYGLWLTVRDLAPVWLPQVEKGDLSFAANTGQLLYALKATGAAEAVRPLAQLVKAGKVAADQEPAVLNLITAQGGPGELDQVLALALGAQEPPARRAAALAALVEGTRGKPARPGGDLGRIRPLLETAELRANALRLIGQWKVAALRPQLLELARASQAAEADRRAALESLAQLGGAENRDALVELTTDRYPVPQRQLAVIALANLDTRLAAERALTVLEAGPADAGAEAVFAALLARKDGAAVLPAVLNGKKLPADVAKVGLRAVRALGREVPPVTDALTKAGGLAAKPQPLTPPQMQALVAEVQKTGDPHRGEQVFRRKELSCVKCHAIAGAGGLVGPDLLSIGASAQVDYLIDSLLLPNKQVKENYETHVVLTSDGKLHTGIRVRQSDRELVLRDAEGREDVIPTSAIEERKIGASLMPEGLVEPLTRGELVDLVRFLSELGKPGPFAVGQAPVVRSWEVLTPSPAVWQALSRVGFASVATDPSLTWAAAVSKVSGALPLADVPRLEMGKGFSQEKDALSAVRFRLTASAAGPVQLALGDPAGVTLWLDGQPVAVQERTTLELKPGPHTVTLLLDRSRPATDVRCEVREVPGSAARWRFGVEKP